MRYFIVFVFIIIFSFKSFSQHNEHDETENNVQEEEFNATEEIMHHISDAHDWHLWTTVDEETGEEHHVSVPLPIILFCNGKLDVFMSSEFHHGEGAKGCFRPALQGSG